MGGTTAKASVIEGGEIQRTGEFEIGGSLSQGSRLNKGSRLPAARARRSTSPRSAPAAAASSGSTTRASSTSGRGARARSRGRPATAQGGTEATLTDANVVPRATSTDERLPSGLAPRRRRWRARPSPSRWPRRSGSTLREAAHGVLLLGCARMARAVRAVTVERGRDPRDFALVAFGGNGPLFAAEMAARPRDRRRCIVPPAPGVFSAVGLLEADLEHHLVRTFLRPLDGRRRSTSVGGRVRARSRREADGAARGAGYRDRRRRDDPGVDLRVRRPVVRADDPGPGRRRRGAPPSTRWPRPSPPSTSGPTATPSRATRSRSSTCG